MPSISGSGKSVWATRTQDGRNSEGRPIDLASSIGTWSVRRKIVDHHARAVYAFAGTAVVTLTDFHEVGKIWIGGRAFETARAYRLAASGVRVQVSYPDGSHFFEMNLTGRQTIRHTCRDDRYIGCFIFRSPDSWAELWRVHGLRKHYSSLSLYQRDVMP